NGRHQSKATDVADVRHLTQAGEAVLQAFAHALRALDETLVLEDLQIPERDGTGGRMAGVRRADHELGVGGRVEDRAVDALRGEEAGERDVRARDGFGERHDVR